MKTLTLVIAILLIAAGGAVFVSKGFSYKEQENVVQIGNLHITATTQKNLYLSPLLGGLSIAAGVVLLIINNRNKK